MEYEALYREAVKIDAQRQGENIFLNDARIVAFLLDNCDIAVPEESVFFVKPLTGDYEGRIMRRFWLTRKRAMAKEILTPQELAAQEGGAYVGNCDFGHLAPNWPNIFKLGLTGMRQRIAQREGPARNPDFVQAELMVLDAAIRFVSRAAEEAERAGRQRMAQGLAQLAVGTPRDLYEGYQLTLLYYCLQQEFETSNVRTMGRLDRLLQPLYEKETDQAYVRSLTRQYMVEIDALKATANLPFALGGTDSNGVSQVNTMSWILLEAYSQTKLPDTKLHILWTEDMPREFLELAMRCIRDGGNSLVFLNNRVVVDGLIKLGVRLEDAVEFSIVGCYESSAGEEVPCSANGKINLAKALEATLHGGKDALTGAQLAPAAPAELPDFPSFWKAYCDTVRFFCEKSIDITKRHEELYPRIHAAYFFNATLDHCVDCGGDAYCDHGARYNNSSINAIGFATAVDSLYAIRKLVYEDKTMTLTELVQLLDSNWEGREPLRRTVWNKFPKFGTNDSRVDSLAGELMQVLSEAVNGKPNARDGVFRLGTISIHWRVRLGEQTAASADGRLSGQTLSQNNSATFGMDREGVTGHILSVAKLPSEDAVNGMVLDLDLHSSMVQGDNGVNLLVATLLTYMEAGGQTVHYNVLNTQILRDAQKHPERYPTLQVRRCGWNVLFNHLSKRDQDEFIRRAEMLEGR